MEACEAAVTALQLMRDKDYADDLWEMAKTEGIGNSCRMKVLSFSSRVLNHGYRCLQQKRLAPNVAPRTYFGMRNRATNTEKHRESGYPAEHAPKSSSNSKIQNV